MKCDEQLYDEGDTFSYRECGLDLGHPGAHQDWGGTKYARPEPSGDLPPAVTALINRAAEKANAAWGLNERKYPVVVEVTNVYVIWETGESEDDALSILADDPYHVEVQNEHPIDGDITVRRITDNERSDMTGAALGPYIACPDCGKLSMRPEWLHNPLRRCHGPIQWRESDAWSLRYRYNREHAWAPVYDAARQAVAA